MTMTDNLPPTLWGEDEPRVRPDDPATSHAAADRNNIHGSRITVLAVLASRMHPTADHEIHLQAELNPGRWADGVVYSESRIRTARNELQSDGMVAVIPDVYGVTPNGGRCRTFKITTKGRTYLAEVTA